MNLDRPLTVIVHKPIALRGFCAEAFIAEKRIVGKNGNEHENEKKKKGSTNNINEREGVFFKGQQYDSCQKVGNMY